MIQAGNNQQVVDTLKLGQLVSASKLGLFVNAVVALALGYVQSEVAPIQDVLAWLCLAGIVVVYRAVWMYVVTKNMPKYEHQEIKTRLTEFQISMLISGLVWGAAGYFLLTPEYPQHEIFLLFMLAGISAGGIVSYAADVPSAALYAVGVLSPLFVRLLWLDSQFSIWMPLAVLVYLVFMIQSLRVTHHEVMDNFLLRIDSSEKESSIKDGEYRYHLLLEHLPVGVFHLNAQREVTFCNQRAIDILHGAEWLKAGASLDQFDDAEMLASIASAIEQGETSKYEGVFSEQPEQWVSLLYAPMKNLLGHVSGGVGIVQDITERKHSARLVEQFALQDALTELPNRRALIDRLQHAIDKHNETKRDIALLYIDLDNFKLLNDTLGHAVGDLLLQQVSKRLTQGLRSRDLIARAARIGGDEFIAVLEDLSLLPETALEQAMLVANKIINKLHAPYKLLQHDYECTVSIGLALYSDSQGNVDDFLKHADIAMYDAKKTRGVIRVYNQEMMDLITRKDEIKRALINAVKNEEFDLYYQIQVDANKQPTGAEALIRWNRPNYGMVPPNDFISIAEETGLIVDIGHWVINQACKQLSIWAKDSTKKRWSIAVNVSAMQLLHPDFPNKVEYAIKQHRINATLLKIEVTESMFLENTDEVIQAMQSLQRIGVGFELDDFGTGYSCLQYLKQLPLRQLKIDQSFVAAIDVDINDQSIVKTIIAMAKGFNINVIAEGVETNSQFELLKEYDCQHFQGYLFGKPMPINAFEDFIAQSLHSKEGLSFYNA